MLFWIFMLIMDFLTPVLMIVFGNVFKRRNLYNLNPSVGYRTKRSSQNPETSLFAHHYCGKLWFICGLVLIPITLIVMCLVIGESQDTVGIVGGILCAVQTIPMIVSIILTESALRKCFDRDGIRRV